LQTMHRGEHHRERNPFPGFHRGLCFQFARDPTSAMP
jgi:hypothetical protein